MVEVKWTPVVIGLVIAIVLGLIIDLVLPGWGWIGYLIATIYVGYSVGEGYMNGAIHGALVGVVAGIIVGIIAIIIGGAVLGALGAAVGLVALVAAVIVAAIIGAIGGAIGGLLKGKPSEKPIAEPVPTARKSPIIVFNLGNIQKCLCPTCPVQAESECAKEKTMKMQEMMGSEEKMTLKYEDVPGMYCTTGKATCTDIDPSKECQCPNCPIWAENDLEHGQPMGVFCRDGKAM
jgi:Family of unknown function (DUF5518)